MKKLLTILLLAFVFTGNSAHLFAQKNLSEDVKESGAILSNLDTLMNLWYVKKSTPARVKRSMNIHGFKPDEVPTYSDSVYYARISKITSPIPYTYNSKVKGFIDLYAVRKREQVERMLGLSEYYFPIFEEVLDKYQMPLELKYLSVVESALNPRAISRVGATGLWQFMYSTGVLYRLNIDSYIDDRRDPYQSTEAAVSFLKDLHDIFGDWFLAIAAYNCGPGNVNKAIRRSGGKRTFWEIYNYLPVETRGYVPAFIAASYVFIYHQDHNLYPQQIPLPMNVDTVIVNKEVSFAPIAQVLDIPVDLVKDLNPQYKKDIIPGAYETCKLRLPASKAYAFGSLKDSIYLCYNKLTHPERYVMVRDTADTTKFVYVNKEPTDKDIFVQPEELPKNERPSSHSLNTTRVYYTVKSGDNIGAIADWYDVSIYSLKRWNHLKSNRLNTGRKLIVMVPADRQSYYRKINSMTAYQKKHLNRGYSPEPAPKKDIAVKKTTPDGSSVKTNEVVQKPNARIEYYIVQKGDTLWSIAQRYPGVTVDDIKKLNGISDNHSLKAGQKIKIQKT